METRKIIKSLREELPNRLPSGYERRLTFARRDDFTYMKLRLCLFAKERSAIIWYNLQKRKELEEKRNGKITDDTLPCFFEHICEEVPTRKTYVKSNLLICPINETTYYDKLADIAYETVGDIAFCYGIKYNRGVKHITWRDLDAWEMDEDELFFSGRSRIYQTVSQNVTNHDAKLGPYYLLFPELFSKAYDNDQLHTPFYIAKDGTVIFEGKDAPDPSMLYSQIKYHYSNGKILAL